MKTMFKYSVGRSSLVCDFNTSFFNFFFKKALVAYYMSRLAGSRAIQLEEGFLN